jgi:hypothetical protein
LWQEKNDFLTWKIWIWGIQKDFKIKKWPKLARNLKKVILQNHQILTIGSSK